MGGRKFKDQRHFALVKDTVQALNIAAGKRDLAVKHQDELYKLLCGQVKAVAFLKSRSWLQRAFRWRACLLEAAAIIEVHESMDTVSVSVPTPGIPNSSPREPRG